MSKPAVLHVTQAVGDESQTVGGVAVVMLDQVQDLVAGGWDVTVAGPDHGRLPDDVTSRGATFARWHADREPGPSVARESQVSCGGSWRGSTLASSTCTAARPVSWVEP